MGYMRVREMTAYGGEDMALRDHLSANLYPPQASAYDFAKKAIDAAYRGEPDTVIVADITAEQVIDDLHLEAFLDARAEADEVFYEDGDNEDDEKG